jgi:hypothetical protein
MRIYLSSIKKTQVLFLNIQNFIYLNNNFFIYKNIRKNKDWVSTNIYIYI